MADGRIACRYRRDGVDHLAVLDPPHRHLQPLALLSGFPSVKPYLRAAGDRLTFLVASPTTSPAVVTLELASGRAQVLAGGGSIPDGYLATPRRIGVPAGDGGSVYARYYPPPTRTQPAHLSGALPCWSMFIRDRPPTPKPAWSCGCSSSPAAASRYSTSTTPAAPATAAPTANA